MSHVKFDFSGESRFLPLFSVPIGRYDDLDFSEVKPKFLELCKKEREKDNQGRIISNRNGWQGKSTWFTDEENSFFRDYIHQMVEKIFYESFDHSGELSFTIGNNCWININPKNGYNTSHTHPGCDYAGVFYVNLPTDSESSIVFDNPISHEVAISTNMYSDNLKHKYGLYAESKISVEEGTMIIFPSCLRHFVEPNFSDEERISMAFNIVINNYGRYAESFMGIYS